MLLILLRGRGRDAFVGLAITGGDKIYAGISGGRGEIYARISRGDDEVCAGVSGISRRDDEVLRI